MGRSSMIKWAGVAAGAFSLMIYVSGCCDPCQQLPPPQCPEQQQCPVCQGPEQPPPVVDGVEQWVSIPFRITFPTSENTLDAQQQALLREVARTLQARGDVRKIRVEGHTDNRGNTAMNQRLSEERARTVLEYLVTLGAPREGLESVGFGATRPLTDNSSEQDRAQDRRVEFSILVVVPHGAM